MLEERKADTEALLAHRRSELCRVVGQTYNPTQWDDWRWQMRHRLEKPEHFAAMLRLTPAERRGLELSCRRFAVAVTPYFASLINPFDPNCPIRRQVVPSEEELLVSPGDMTDPCGEEHDTAVPGLIHRYPDRVLLLATDICASYCRYCTRSRLIGHSRLEPLTRRLGRVLEYLQCHPEVRDVLVSGGDPLLMSEARLDMLLGTLRTVPHLELLRVGSRVPSFLPQRVTRELVAVLRRHQVWLSLHFSHPDELTPEVAKACELLADGGIPLGSQTVLLRGVNDSPEVLQRLLHGLIKLRVRPYYLYQADPVVGTGHLRTGISRGIEIMRALRGHTSGYAVPTYVVDAPNGGGKIPVQPETIVSHSGDSWQLRNWAGEIYTYVDPPAGREAQ